jgi:NAD(P)H-dependent flavin oxidoreductase YrpB (nitropropane dioxygenase family)
MTLKTRVTERLGIRYPIIQGGMHHVGYAVLAAAVSNAGGLGTITALTFKSPELLKLEIQLCKSLTKFPFAVNLTLLPMMAPPDYDAYCSVIIEQGVKIVETAGANPGRFIKKFKDVGITVIHKCVAVQHAISAKKYGADIISMDGFECAGHPGENDVGNFVLLAIAAKKLDIPFIASGGVGTGAQLAAALALGADGVNMGTRFMATKEAPVHESIKKALVSGNENMTMLVMKSLRNTERVYKNEASMKVAEIEKEHPNDFPAIRHLVNGEAYRKAFQETGDTQHSVWSCGVVMGLIDDIPSCKELIERMVAEAEDIIQNRLPKFIAKL